MPAALALSGAFVSAVYTLTGTVNQQAFRYFEPGEALFVGARAQWQGGEPFVAVTFEFECRPNKEEYVNGITGIQKKGWQYLWIWYEAKEDTDRLVRMPKFAFLQDVYEEKSWSPLLIPGIAPAKPKAPRAAQQVRQEAAAFQAN